MSGGAGPFSDGDVADGWVCGADCRSQGSQVDLVLLHLGNTSSAAEEIWGGNTEGVFLLLLVSDLEHGSAFICYSGFECPRHDAALDALNPLKRSEERGLE